MSSSVRLLVIIFALSVTAGGMALVAQAKGARDPKRVSFVVRQSISMAPSGCVADGYRLRNEWEPGRATAQAAGLM